MLKPLRHVVRAGRLSGGVGVAVWSGLWLLVGLCVVLADGSRLQASTLKRVLPATYLPGELLEVTLQCDPTPGVQVHAWEDAPPEGWRVEFVSDAGFLDVASGKIKWGLYLDDLPRTVTYRLRVPAVPVRRADWSGQAVFDGQVILAGGSGVSALPPSTVVRDLPSFYVSGGTMDLVWTVTPDPLVKVYAVEDELPTGWSASQLNLGGVWDPVTRRVKWGPFFDGQPRVLTCRVSVPGDETRLIGWNGLGRFNELEVVIGGDSELDRQPSGVTRVAPEFHAPGVLITVTNVVRPASWVRVHAVEEDVPEGWSVTNISHGGVWDVQTARIKWGPFSDATSRGLSYQLITTAGDASFRGRARFNESEVEVEGVTHSRFQRTRIERLAAATFVPGASYAITNRTVPGPGIHVHAVEEKLPEGWVVQTLSEGGVYDGLNRKLKWGPFNDATPRTLVAVLVPGRGEVEGIQFEGQGWDDFGLITVVGVEGAARIRSTVVRALPSEARFGEAFQVRLEVTPTSDVRVYALEELPPEGWVVSAISDQGVFDSASGKVKWGPFSDAQPRVLTYSLVASVPPRASTSTGLFGGHGVFDLLDVETTGAGYVRAVSGSGSTVTMGIVGVAGNRVEVTVLGSPGAAYAIQTSADLVVWTLWRTGVANASGRLSFSDAVRLGGAFYRVSDP